MRQAGGVTDPDPHDDPVLEKRRRIARLTNAGQRIGYTLYLVATIGFFVGLVTGYASWLVTVIIVSLLVGSVVLAPAIVFSYAVKAANRADRDDDW
jgi:hypothetical protein